MLEVGKGARELLAKEAYDPASGARLLRRALQRQVEDTLSEEMLEGKWNTGDVIRASVKGETLKFTKVKGAKGIEPQLNDDHDAPASLAPVLAASNAGPSPSEAGA